MRPASVISLATFGDAPDVFDAVVVGEAEIAVQPMANIVAVQQERMLALGVQQLLQRVGDRGLAGAGIAGEPDDGRRLVLDRRARLFIDVGRLPMDVGRATQGVIDHAGPDGGVGEAVDEDEIAGDAIGLVGVERDRRLGRDVARLPPRSY